MITLVKVLCVAAVLLAPWAALGSPLTYHFRRDAPPGDPGSWLYIDGTIETDGTLGPITQQNITAFNLTYAMSALSPVCADPWDNPGYLTIAYPFPAGTAYIATAYNPILVATEAELYVDLSATSVLGAVEIKQQFTDPWGGGHETYLGYRVSVYPPGYYGPEPAMLETFISEHLNNCEPQSLSFPPTKLVIASREVLDVQPAPAVSNPHLLQPAMPNPFNASTTIRFEMPRADRVELTIFDVAGRPVRRLMQESMDVGSHMVVWRGEDDNGRQVVPGVYLCRLQLGSHVETRRMMLLK